MYFLTPYQVIVYYILLFKFSAMEFKLNIYYH